MLTRREFLADQARFLDVQAEFGDIKVPNQEAAERTRQAIDGALKDLASLGAQGAPP